MPETIVIDNSDPLYSLCMLLGREGKEWIYYETDPGWWTLRLWTRRD